MKLLFCFLMLAIQAHAQGSKKEKPLDTLRFSLGMNMAGYSNTLVNPNLELSYRFKPHFSYRAGLGFARYQLNEVVNASNTLITGAYGSLGVGVYALSWNQKQYESWLLAADLVYSNMVHTADVQIPYAYGTYRAHFSQSFYAYGLRLVLARYIRILWATNRINFDIGMEIGFFHIRYGLPSDYYIPGGGNAIYNDTLSKATTFFPRIAVHYRF